MPAKKIVDETEVKRWFAEGRTYAWMSAEYRRKYHIEMASSAWGAFRRRHALPRRNARDDESIPWQVEKQHRWARPLVLLRDAARVDAGFDIPEKRRSIMENWRAKLAEQGVVVHYDPDTEQGFFYVPAREGVDTGLIRVPERKTTLRANGDV